MKQQWKQSVHHCSPLTDQIFPKTGDTSDPQQGSHLLGEERARDAEMKTNTSLSASRAQGLPGIACSLALKQAVSPGRARGEEREEGHPHRSPQGAMSTGWRPLENTPGKKQQKWDRISFLQPVRNSLRALPGATSLCSVTKFLIHPVNRKWRRKQDEKPQSPSLLPVLVTGIKLRKYRFFQVALDADGNWDPLPRTEGRRGKRADLCGKGLVGKKAERGGAAGGKEGWERKDGRRGRRGGEGE